MDLKEDLEKIRERVDDTLSAYHAGHSENIAEILRDVMAVSRHVLETHPEVIGDVTGSATSETPTEVQTETPAEVPGAPAQPGAVPAADAARSVGTGSAEPKPPQ